MRPNSDHIGKTFSLFLVISFLFHWAIIVTFSLYRFPLPLSAQQIEKKSRTRVNIKNIRTLGERKSTSQHFSLAPKEQAPTNKRSAPKSVDNLSLESLAFSKRELSTFPSPEKKKTLEIKRQIKSKDNRQFAKRAMQENTLNDMAKSSTKYQALRSKSFDISYEPPKGIPEDEFNSFERIFFTFQKRSFEKYLNSFVKEYHDAREIKPQIDAHLNSKSYLLKARVTFDKSGNIVKIKILKSVENNDIHELFEKTLKGIDSLPNPPKFLVENQDEFNIYYSLKIN